MSAREDVLARVRAALQDRPRPEPPDRTYRSAGFRSASLEQFTERLTDYRAAVHRCDEDGVPALLGELLAGTVAVPAGLPPAWLPLVGTIVEDEPALDVRALDVVDSVVTGCALAIAETGTVVLDGGPGQGRRALTLVPDHHVVVVLAEQVVADVPDALVRLDPLRPQTWISGPSATSDIELERVEGVHGPRRLDVVLVVPRSPMDQPAATGAPD